MKVFSWGFILFFPLEHIPLFLHLARLSVLVSVVETYASSGLEGVAYIEGKPGHSALSQFFVVSQTSVHVQVACYIFNSIW